MPKRDESAIDYVADIMRNRITSGVYGSAGTLPTTSTLGNELGHDRTLVGEAMVMLRNEGLIRFEKQRYVVDNVHFTLPGLIKGFEPWMREQGYTPVIENLIQPEIIGMSKEIADLFDLPEGYRAVHRMRKQIANNIPLFIGEIWYPAELAGEMLLEMTDNPNMPVIDAIKTMRGVYIVKTREKLNARIPTKKEREWLKLSRYQPVLEVIRTNIDQHGNPIMFNRSIAVGTKITMEYEYSPEHWS